MAWCLEIIDISQRDSSAIASDPGKQHHEACVFPCASGSLDPNSYSQLTEREFELKAMMRRFLSAGTVW